MTDTILNTIRKLLILANDNGATEGEVQAALGRVASLSAKHNISDVDIQKAQRADGSVGVRINVDVNDLVDEIAFSARNLQRWDKWLSLAIEQTVSVGVYIGWGKAEGCRHGAAVRFYGLPQDVAVARELFLFARKALSGCAKRWAREQRQAGRLDVQSNSAPVRTFKDGFCKGLIDAATERRAQIMFDGVEKTEAPVEGSTALVLVADVAKAKATAIVAKGQTLGLKTSRRTGARSWGGSDAHNAGKAAGRATNLSRNAIA